MDILFVASELAPMVKVGGLGDVTFALSKALRLLGHKVTILLPRFPAFEASGVMLARRLTPMKLPAASGAPGVEVTLFDARLGSSVDLVLIDVPGLFDRGDGSPESGVYGEGGAEYADNARRFGVLCRAAIEVMRDRAVSGQPFDVVHLHDWPTAPVAYLAKLVPELASTKTVLTIHNLAHQGLFGVDALAELGLDRAHFTPERLEFYGGLSFLKSGIMAADAVTTVSPTYADDIQTKEKGERLDGVLKSRTSPLVGIVNGVDYAVWNPATDPALIARYDAEDPSNKGRCKSAVLSELGLEIAPERPLVVSLGRVVAQKGSDLLAEALPRLLKLDVSVVVAGSGTPELERALQAGLGRAPERARFLGQVPETMAHKLIAAADLMLLPSRYEPCGLVQLYAQRYGALPIASRTGGLVDTIVDLDAGLESGTGFLFDGPTTDDLVGAVQRAVSATLQPRWRSVVRRAMRLDLGWDRPARRYAQLYKSLAQGRPTGERPKAKPEGTIESA
jgi:starch synthase